MPGLPKIALARLKANPEASKPSGPSVGPAGFQGAEHPDANLLAALVEKTLTEKERAQVLNHLSQCADCRAIAALTLPWEVAEPEPTRAPAQRRWNPWSLLRWGAMAAVLGALTVVVVLHPGMYRHQDISKETPPAAPAGNITRTRQTPSAPLLAPSPAAPVQAKAQLEARMEPQGSARGMATMGKASAPRRDIILDDQEAPAKAKKQVTMMAASRPPAPVSAVNLPAVKAEADESNESKESKGANTRTAGALPAPALPSAPAGEPTAASEEAGKASAELHAGPTALGAVSHSAAAEGGSSGGTSTDAVSAKMAPRVTSRAALGMKAQASVSEMSASRKDMGYGAGRPHALWSVSSDGKVQHSTDGGKNFKMVDVAHGIKFRTIASLGGEVWTGGTGGALFHSVDGGTTWNRVGIDFEGTAITETIAEIQLHNPQHLTVTTASGSQWVSEDGGQHWQKHP